MLSDFLSEKKNRIKRADLSMRDWNVTSIHPEFGLYVHIRIIRDTPVHWPTPFRNKHPEDEGVKNKGPLFNIQQTRCHPLKPERKLQLIWNLAKVLQVMDGRVR